MPTAPSLSEWLGLAARTCMMKILEHFVSVVVEAARTAPAKVPVEAVGTNRRIW
jgi:hypothetical protein